MKNNDDELVFYLTYYEHELDKIITQLDAIEHEEDLDKAIFYSDLLTQLNSLSVLFKKTPRYLDGIEFTTQDSFYWLGSILKGNIRSNEFKNKGENISKKEMLSILEDFKIHLKGVQKNIKKAMSKDLNYNERKKMINDINKELTYLNLLKEIVE